MDLQNSFTVPSDIDTAWKTLLDVEKVAPCMPGATLESVDGDELTGNVKVKLGPVSMTYGGKMRFVSLDEQAHTAVLEGTGKETRGTGTAQATVTTLLVSEGPSSTRVDVTTDLTITGKAAQFGRGIMQDVAARIIDQFAGNLAALMETAQGQSAHADSGQSAGSDASVETAKPPPPKAAESIDLLGAAGAPVLKRAVPALIGVVVAAVLIVWVIKR